MVKKVKIVINFEPVENSKDIAIKSSYLSIVGNIFMAVTKGFVGIVGNSYAMIADAIESTTDIFASVLVLFGLKYSMRPADKNHPYGHGKAEALFTFIVVGFLVIAATVIAFQSILNMQRPHSTPEPYTLIVLGVIIVIKETFYRIVLRNSKKINSSVLKADAWHHRSDAITSLMAFIGISIAILFGEGFEHADDVAALFASFFILYNAYKIFRPALGEIMDEHLYEELEAEIRNISITVEGVIDTEKCFIRKTGMKHHVDLHLIVNGNISVREGHSIAHRLKEKLIEKLPVIADVLIHVEPE